MNGARRGDRRHLEGRDLLVVGGGPVGVAMGVFAAARGLSATVVERVPEVYNKARAIGMDAETVRTFQTVDLADEIVGITTPILGAEFVDAAGERLTGVEMPPGTLTPLGYPPMNMYFQPELEHLLRERARASGVELLLGEEIVDFEPHHGAVEAPVDPGVVPRAESWVEARVRPSVSRAPTEEGAVPASRTLRARWMVAADGASSGVRKALGIDFLDLGFDQEWLVVDTRLVGSGGADLPRVAQQICDPHRPATFVPGHGANRRWEFQLQPDDDREAVTEPEQVWRLLSPWLAPGDAVVERAVVYRFHATVASATRVGPVFLAGDAAHQMPPFLGQGLCSGFRDVANLAWKLQSVKRGHAGDRLLDSYDVERRPHVTGLVEHACDTGRLIDQFAGRVDSKVGADAGYGGDRPFPHLTTGLVVGQDQMVGRQIPQPTVGGRPLDELLGDGWALVVGDDIELTPQLRSRWASIAARVVDQPGVLASIPFAPQGSVVVVRPDRVVAAVATAGQIADVTDELFAWFA